MDTRQVVLVDAFATEPTGGVPVAVVPDGTNAPDDRLRAVARELDAIATALPTDGSPADLRAVGPGGPVDRHPQIAVGGVALAAERGWIDPGDVGLTTAGDADVTVDDVGRTWVGLDEPDPQPADVAPETIADALGVDVAALRDVGADLPPFRVSAAIEALAAPVNFLEHLGSAAVDRGALADLAEAAGVEAVCVFTFDTLTAEATCHARTFIPETRRSVQSPAIASPSPWVRTVDGEVPATPAVAGGVATYLCREAVIEDGQPVVEQGHYLDRPGRVHVDPGDVRVGGRAVTSFDGTMTLPPSDDGDILEA